ncbi:hypothetical protein EPN87_01365 [archaeon]|nr:MAG: hypothetical protein EPN87_01365 [archaeon]
MIYRCKLYSGPLPDITRTNYAYLHVFQSCFYLYQSIILIYLSDCMLNKLAFVPIVLFILSLGVLFYNYSNTGDFILRDIDLKGGTLITIETSQPVDVHALETALLREFSSVSVSGLKTSAGYGANIEVAADTNTTSVLNVVNQTANYSSFSVQTIGSDLGNFFFQQVIYLLIAAFVLMSIIIYFIYRNAISSFGIVFATFANIITTLAVTSLLGIRISFAGFAGLLMLIAYTVDTNIVLTTKVLKSSPQEFRKQYKKALITGVTLIATVSITMFVVQLISTSRLLVNISQVLLIGFLIDLIYTWMFDSSLLEWFVKRRYK